jgi:hypothetical protein
MAKKPIEGCDCAKWEHNMPALNSILMMHQVRVKNAFKGDKFEFCPWCAKEL